ncbi:universal stress protein [Natrialbaceae archaeon AArc-T1-2]|uniref:universal stress protein n=1 Tax=Natrialbaceae archaeon AArc-T1-2 TaxID=3053904 RepID=UPI00255B0A18|nr:universal stress protein [Natrialbaceae archaeon AArc-T1-2]WIV68360.1 universal stress protein [Natrialbaceae archaeon AArc-T1-2]
MTVNTTDADGRLLVPIANAEAAERQLPTAIDVATDRNLEIILCYVLDVPPQLSLQDGKEYLLEDEDETMLADAMEVVESAGVPAERRIRIARGVAAGILSSIEAYDADAVFMGWRGRPPREDRVLGGYLDTVLKKATCDVLVERIKTPRPESIDSVLVPVAGGPHDAFATEVAGATARQHDASVQLVHVMATDDPELSRRDAETLLRQATGSLEGVSSIERVIVERDDVAGAITDRTADHDVTFLGVSRGGVLERTLLGTVSEAVGRHAAGSVVLAKRYEPVSSRFKRLLP